MRFFPIVIIGYPFITHLSVLMNNPVPALISLCLLIAVMVQGNNGRNALILWITLLIAGGTILSYYPMSQHFLILYVPPVALSVSLFWLFARSLKSSSTPLAARVANLYHDELSPELALYTRNITLFWSVIFALFIVETIFLAIFASLYVWSLMVNFINYLIIFGFIVGEYFIRLYRFPEVHHIKFIEFLRLLRKTDVRASRQS